MIHEQLAGIQDGEVVYRLQDLWFQSRKSKVYLLHFEQRIGGRASHYIGFTQNLCRRLREHRRKRKSTNKCALTRTANQREIRWVVAKVWNANRDFETYLKQQKNAKRYCPICQGIPF